MLSSHFLGSTLFLDDVDQLQLEAQAVLSEFLNLRAAFETQPGKLDPPQPDLCVIVGTGKDLFTLVRQGLFNAELFYRLNVLHIDLTSTHSEVHSLDASKGRT